ncbi:MAG: hypothetical protein CFH06_00344 [Alphaproteobacteria bacterium MarineAlpha3_Bin5]|nr:acyl-CoA synthetase [Magnetovibrio sp.]PPR79509.1 MAG: hypothetical protein CFH06_00344 [Alphaproteobacteria bacterium MarineAlpha3_Bin5]
MTPKQRKNIAKLFNPRHIAIIGGRDAEVVIGECLRIGYQGSIWPVNPKRKKIAGIKCFKSIDDLPGPPDAAYIAIPREAAVEAVRSLSNIGAGGVVCYTAGFGEVGKKGAELEKALINEAGELALVGPNCYGIINYIGKVALWPFAHGGSSPGFGAAIITQSGMLSSDLTMSQRSFPFAYMISAGNQSVLQLEHYIDFLSDLPEVRAIGLHIEGLTNVSKFSTACLKAIKAKVPIVALKTGASKIGSQLTSSHTASLSGDDDLYQALFDQLGIISVSNPVQLIETLKFISIAGLPKGYRVAGLTCSGGSATMIADYSERVGLTLPKPSANTHKKLTKLLPHTATVSNPLDYTTPIWGITERVTPVFQSFLSDSAETAVLVQDYPLPGLDESKQSYLNDAMAFITSVQNLEIPGAICSTFPENMDKSTREMLIENNIAPMQGLHETLNAVAGAAWHYHRRKSIKPNKPIISPVSFKWGTVRNIDEWEAKKYLNTMKISIPPGQLTTASQAPRIARKIGFPVAVKIVKEGLAHKTEVGAVALNLSSAKEVEMTIAQMTNDYRKHFSTHPPDCFLVEKQVGPVLAELLVNIRIDKIFGLVMTLASGGIFTELIDDKETILLPATRREFSTSLKNLKIAHLIAGYRGKPRADRKKIIDALVNLANHFSALVPLIREVEINPLLILSDCVSAVDAAIWVASQPKADFTSA